MLMNNVGQSQKKYVYPVFSLRLSIPQRVILSYHAICHFRLPFYGVNYFVLCLSKYNQLLALYMLCSDHMQFIQKPGSQPDACLQLLVPSTAVLHQSALGHYLRQNLHQFTFSPKYQDGGRPESMFQDYTAASGSSSPHDSDVYLYRPQLTGSNG